MPDFQIQPIYSTKRANSKDIPDYEVFLDYDALREKYGEGVPVTVLDNGIALNHVDLDKHIISTNDHTGEGINAGDHGTHVAGIITSQHGLSKTTKLKSEKVLSTKGHGSIAWVLKGIEEAKRNGSTILQMSLGSDSPSQQIEDALADFVSNPLHFAVIASGNDSGLTDYPAMLADKYDGIISVGAADIDKDGNVELAYFSSRGVVTVVYQGVDVLSTIPNNKYSYKSGTSMAAPGVSAMISTAKKIYPEFTQNDFHTVAKMSTIDIDKKGIDKNSGYGFLIPMRFLSNVECLRDGLPFSDEPIVKITVSLWSRLLCWIGF